MLRFLILFCFVFLEKNAVSFEMEVSGKQENIFFVKKKNNKTNNVVPRKKTIVINKEGNKINTTGKVNRAVVAEKREGKVVNVNQINGSKGMYASADDIVVPKANVEEKKTQATTTDKTSKKTLNNVPKKTINKSKPKVLVSASSKGGAVKDLISNNKKQVYSKPVKHGTVDKLCEMAVRNDVVNFKKTLMSVNFAKEYVNSMCDNGNTLLMTSVINDNYLTCKLLLENNANVNISNEAKVSVLHAIVKYDTSNADRMFKLLIKTNGINFNLQDIEGYTPAMRALLFDKFSYVKTLIELGADIYIKNNYGEDLLDLARKQLKVASGNEKKELEEIVRILQEVKSNV